MRSALAKSHMWSKLNGEECDLPATAATLFWDSGSGIWDLGSGIRDLASVIWNQWSVGRGWFLAHFGCTIQVQWNGFRAHPDDLSRWRCGVLCFISAVTMRDTDNVTFAWVATCDIKTLKGILLSAKTVAFADTCERADPAPSRDRPIHLPPPSLRYMAHI